MFVWRSAAVAGLVYLVLMAIETKLFMLTELSGFDAAVVAAIVLLLDGWAVWKIFNRTQRFFENRYFRHFHPTVRERIRGG